MIYLASEEVDLLKDSCIHYGKKTQRIKAMEELAELIQAIAKDNKESIIEEIADVAIMIRQIRILYEIDAIEVYSAMDGKIKRLERQINKDNKSYA